MQEQLPSLVVLLTVSVMALIYLNIRQRENIDMLRKVSAVSAEVINKQQTAIDIQERMIKGYEAIINANERLKKADETVKTVSEGLKQPN